MTAGLVHIRVMAGGPEPYFTMMVYPDVIMGWQADVVVLPSRLSDVRTSFSQRNYPYTVNRDTENGWPRIRASLGSVQQDIILRQLRGLTPVIDRRHPELFYRFAELAAGGTVEPNIVLTVNTTDDTVTVRQHLEAGIEPWPTDMWERVTASLSGHPGFGSDLLSAHGDGGSAITIRLSRGGMDQLNAYGLTIVELAASVFP